MTIYQRRVRFTPLRRDDLRQAVLPWVDGEPFDVLNMGTMDEGPYEGQTIWMPEDHDVMPGVSWIPDCDLTDATD